MILAAGRGERMRPLTDKLPKPLLKVGGVSLIERLIQALVSAGLKDILVNHAHLGQHIVETLGDGRRYAANIVYSHESEGELETGGGIFRALDLLSDPFLVVNGDILTDYPFNHLLGTLSSEDPSLQGLAQLLIRRDEVSAPFALSQSKPMHPSTLRQAQDMPSSGRTDFKHHLIMSGLAHIVLVNNPPHHPQGDFHLTRNRVTAQGANKLTFSGIGVYRKALFQNCSPGKFSLAPVLRAAMDAGEISGEHYAGRWWDIGTPERLAQLDAQYLADPW